MFQFRIGPPDFIKVKGREERHHRESNKTHSQIVDNMTQWNIGIRNSRIEWYNLQVCQVGHHAKNDKRKRSDVEGIPAGEEDR
jgi:hypothetical protein